MTTPIILTIIATGIGWFVAHRYNMQRDFENKKREIRLTYLIETYRRLEYASNRTQETQFEGKLGNEAAVALTNALEKALGEIQLLGSLEQIDMAQKAAKDMVTQKSCSFDELLYDLRASLRKDLELQEAPHKLRFLRVHYPKD